MNEIREMLNGLNGFLAALAALTGSGVALWRMLRQAENNEQDEVKQEDQGSEQPELTPADKRRRRLLGTTVVFGSLAVVFIVFAMLPPPPAPPPPTREKLLERAWNARNGNDWGQVAELTTSLLESSERSAEKKQQELIAQKEPEPKTGRVGADLSESEERRNHTFGLINDVATALFLRGLAYKALGKDVEARADWNKVKTFSHAVTYDIQTKEFWRTREGAENELHQLDKN